MEGGCGGYREGTAFATGRGGSSGGGRGRGRGMRTDVGGGSGVGRGRGSGRGGMWTFSHGGRYHGGFSSSNLMGRGGGGRGSWGSASGQERVIPQMHSLNISPEGDNSGNHYSGRTIRLRVNHFLLKYDPERIIRHYYLAIKPDAPAKNGLPVKLPRSLMSMIRNKLFLDDPTRFDLSMTVYDGEKNLFSTVSLPEGKFKVELSEDEGTRIRSFIVEVQLVKELKCDKLDDYLSGKIVSTPRDILQALDVVMKENPMKKMIYAGGIFHPVKPYPEDDLGRGITASRGMKHTLKPTSQGIVVCLDYSVLPLRKKMPVIDYLKEQIQGFNLNNFSAFGKQVERALKGLKVTVTHRTNSQNFRIAGLADENAQDISFDVDQIPERKVRLVDYFREKYGKSIMHGNIPCLDLGKNNRKAYVPMEFCCIAAGQRLAKELLDKYQSDKLRKISLAQPKSRESTIHDMIHSSDGPCSGDVSRNFGIGVDLSMTTVTGRVLAPPELKLGTSGGSWMKASVDREKCHWNLNRKSVIHSKPIRLWGVLDFSNCSLERFIPELISRSERLDIRMEELLVCEHHPINLLRNVDSLQKLLERINNECYRTHGGHLQILICVLPKDDPGYGILKWVCETRVGILTQCCLPENIFRPKDQYLANLALKINAKLGGSNVELIKQPSRLHDEGHVMFIGADVNHPGPYDGISPSIAAVVATMNWPAANQYSTRICPQDNQAGKILKFGAMCLELVNAYANLNQVRPEKIVVFRDGVSESQFGMVLNEELNDLKATFELVKYFPAITLIVAQKRHTTRLFLGNNKNENVPPGTVVDTVITSPSGFDFYLCSHFGQIGTSKPAHYQVLQNKIEFSPIELQEFIYNICFTSAQCTKPVSLVPPVVYADRAAYRGRLYYNAAMEFHQSSSSSSGPSTSSMASFDEKPFKLHPNLENSMFFI